MRKLRFRLAVILFLLLALPAGAELAAIHAAALPQETSVLAALDDATQLEAYSSSFTQEWRFPVSKDEVATRLGKDLGFLQASLKSHPQNVELLLLTGLVAHYAYNVDVPNSEDATLAALKQATALAPTDFRGPWFHASFLCQTFQVGAGAEELLKIEAERPWQQLPPGFWSDYMACTQLVVMPAHLLRAADHRKELHAPETQTDSFLMETAEKIFDSVDLTRNYDPKDAWNSDKAGDAWDLTGTACGLRTRIQGKWEVQRLSLTKGSCVALFGTGPYKAKKGSLSPSILILVQHSKENQSLQDFLTQFTNPEEYTSEPDPDLPCPVPGCLARKITQSGTYGKNGDQHGRILVFERDDPQYPGLLFESPHPPPRDKPGSGPTYYRPRQILKRMPGKLYYEILLDAAASIEQPALQDFDYLLKNLKIE